MTEPTSLTAGRTTHVDITPPMVEASVAAYGSFEPGWDAASELVCEFFTGMMRAGLATGTSNSPVSVSDRCSADPTAFSSSPNRASSAFV